MSFPDVDHLIQLPTGCGEQTLIKTGINYVVGKYLSTTDQLSSEEDRKIRHHIQIGVLAHHVWQFNAFTITLNLLILG